MNRPIQNYKCKAAAPRTDESRYFAHCLFGRCDDAAPDWANDWRGAVPAPKKAA